MHTFKLKQEVASTDHNQKRTKGEGGCMYTPPHTHTHTTTTHRTVTLRPPPPWAPSLNLNPNVKGV